MVDNNMAMFLELHHKGGNMCQDIPHTCKDPQPWDFQLFNLNPWAARKTLSSQRDRGSQSVSIIWKQGIASLESPADTIIRKTELLPHQLAY